MSCVFVFQSQSVFGRKEKGTCSASQPTRAERVKGSQPTVCVSGLLSERLSLLT